MEDKPEMLHLTVNGVLYSMKTGKGGEVAHSDTLAYVLRDILGLTGTKTPCSRGSAGRVPYCWTEKYQYCHVPHWLWNAAAARLPQ